jgi:hypothetical protein
VIGDLAAVRPRFDHLRRLTDERGLFEHALFGEPRPEHGYCLDDVARGLVVVCRQQRPDASVRQLAHRYLDFTLAAVVADGSCHNRMSIEGSWQDVPGLGDWWGRALWGLGVAAVHAPTPLMRARALAGFRVAAARRSPYLHAMAFAALGAAEVRLARPDEISAFLLLRDAATSIATVATEPAWPWPWPEPRLSYGNGSIVEAVLAAGQALPDRSAGRLGLRMLDFLSRAETGDGHLSVTPVGGRGSGDCGPAFDQQPIEVAALADAFARAHAVTGDARWLAGVQMAWAWFEGDNDAATPMVDHLTGGGFDGLQRHGRNGNQGAESTLAALSTAQHAQRLGALV